MIPLMFLLGQQLSGSGDASGQVTPPGSIPSTCISNCNSPLPEIKDSTGQVVNIGDYWSEQGGYYSGLFTLTGNEVYALIISPKQIGEKSGMFATTISAPLIDNISNVMTSIIDGKQNTFNAINYMNVNSISNQFPLLSFVSSSNSANLNGFNDWYIPAKEECLLMYKYLKPDTGCLKYNTTSCTQQFINSRYLLCNTCETSTITQTSVNIFKSGQPQSISHLPSTPVFNTVYVFYTSSKSDNSDNSFTNILNFAFKDMYQNVFGDGWKNNGYYYGITRLVRRVLVS